MTMRILFLVNNDALSDSRVVKTAEHFAAQGHECTVMGAQVKEPAFACEQNRVRYVVHKLPRSHIASLIVGMLPNAYTHYWQRRVLGSTVTNYSYPLRSVKAREWTTPSARTAAETATATQKEQPQSFDQRRGAFSRLVRLPLRVLIKLLAMCKRALRLLLLPERTSLGVRLFFGRYLRTFFRPALSERADVIYCHELWLLETAALLKRSMPATPILAYDSHELELHRRNDWSLHSNRTRTSYEGQYIKDADLTVTVCGSIADYIADQYRIPPPHVVPNAPARKAYLDVPQQGRLRKVTGLPNQTIAIYTGNIAPGRGIDVVLQSIALLPELHLVIVGTRNAFYDQPVIVQAEQLEIAKRVHFVDKIEVNHLLSFISEADIAVVPIQNVCLSYYYSLPNKMFEATLAGLPVIASNLPELANFIKQHGVGIVVDFNATQETVTAMERLIEQPEQFNSQERAARIRHSINFETYLEPVENALAALLAQTRHRERTDIDQTPSE